VEVTVFEGVAALRRQLWVANGVYFGRGTRSYVSAVDWPQRAGCRAFLFQLDVGRVGFGPSDFLNKPRPMGGFQTVYVAEHFGTSERRP